MSVMRDVLNDADDTKYIVFVLCAVILVMNVMIISIITLLNMYHSAKEISLMRLDPSGREMVFIPAILDIIQNYAVDCMEKDLDLLGGLSYYGNNLSKNKGMDIVFFEGDICSSVTQADKDLNFTPSIMVMDEDDADKHMTEGRPNTLVSYVVYPSDGAAGSYCYKMLIDAQTHKLYYYRKHKLSKKLGPGFLLEDIKRIS